MSNAKSIEKIFDKAVRTTNIHEGVALIENSTGDFSVSFGHGGKDVDSPIMVDYSGKLTISHLLFQNSGLPDPFEEGGAKKEAIAKDAFTSFEQKLSKVKKLRPHFLPGENRAYYSDFNYDLLGEIIQNKVNTPFHEVGRVAWA